jgi:hypothetical protein
VQLLASAVTCSCSKCIHDMCCTSCSIWFLLLFLTLPLSASCPPTHPHPDSPIIEQPKPDPLGRKLGSKDVEGPAELPPGMVLAGSEAAAAKAAKAAKKNAKRNAKKKVAGEGGDGRSEAGSQSLSSEALQQLPDAPRRIDPEHAAHMGGSAFIMDPQAYLRMLGMDSDDVSGDEDDDDHDVGGRGGYDMAQGMAQAISPASDDHGWVSAGAGAAGARLGEASLRRLQAQQQHPLQLGGLVHAVEEEESGADTASLDAALQVSLDVQQRHAELAAQEEADMAAALEASRQAAAAEASRRQQLQQQLWQADAWTPQVPAVAAEEAADEEAAVAAALAASLAEENRRLEEIRMAEASYAAARAAERQQEEAARAAALRAQQEAAREAALAAALQPTYATSLPAPTVPYPSAAPVVATAAGQLQTAGGYFPMPAKSPVAATGSLPWLVPVLGPSVTAAPAPAPASGYPMAAPIVGGAGCGEEEEDDDLDLEELKGLLVGAC